MPTQLPPKENTLFKRILKCYEQKQYKNGLKFCKQILSNPKFSEHGETLAMKGLTLNSLGRKQEAYDYVRKGLRNDLKSHVCWHVFGLLQRSDRKYDEAIKCYRNALKWDKDNIQILRDLSLLQIQMRDLEGFRDTRYQLLKLRPAMRQSWIGYSISHYLLGNYDMAFQIVEEFRKTQYQENQPKAPVDFEHSEMLLYENTILRESKKWEEAVEHLLKFEQFFTDKLQVKELKGKLYLEFDKMAEAEEIYRELLRRNPENCSYYALLESCIKPASESERHQIYAEYRKMYPRAQAPRRLPLDFATGAVFEELLDSYLRTALRKGVPPLFVNLRGLYGNPEKVTVIERVVTNYVKSLEEHGTFCPSEKTKEDPTVLLWTYFYLAQHYDYQRKSSLALKYIDAVLDHTPTLIEGYMIKAKIYKHAGCMREAVKFIDEGRSLDTADRYVNSKCAQYLLRANQLKKAEEVCGLFTREGVSPAENLDEMQCMWYETECAKAYQRLDDVGEALKKCHQIDRIFSEITEDQFDFHTYCMRKVTLCAYVRLLKLEDVLRSHKFYFNIAYIAIECYLRLHDKPYQEKNNDEDAMKANLSAQDLKKLKSKERRKQKKKQQQQQQEEKKANEGKENRDPEKKEEKKEKIDASALAKTEKPLEEAIKFLIPLQTLAKDRLETHLMAFEIYYRKVKPLLMLQSLKRAMRINTTHPWLHECIVRFVKSVQAGNGISSDVVKEVLNAETTRLLGDSVQDLEKYNDDCLVKHGRSLQWKVSVAKMMYHLNQERKDTVLEYLTDLNESVEDRTLELCSSVYTDLSQDKYGACPSVAADYKARCHQIFPYAELFDTEKPNENGLQDKVEAGEETEARPESPVNAVMNGPVGE